MSKRLEYQRRYRAANRDKVNEYARKWRERNPEKLSSYWKKRHKLLQEAWGYAGTQGKWKEALKDEVFAVQNILPKEGFEVILHCSTIFRFFPFDVITMKDGERCLVEITCKMSKDARKMFDFMKALAVRGFVLFLKPDHSKYFIKEIIKRKWYMVRSAEILEI